MRILRGWNGVDWSGGEGWVGVVGFVFGVLCHVYG